MFETPFPLAQNNAVGGFAALLVPLVFLAVAVLVIAGLWRTFSKAGKPGWGALVPIYNLVLLLEIAQRPLWWIVLFLIPGVNVIALVIVALDVAKHFGKGAGFGVGLAFLGFVFYPILGFGEARYQPAA